MPPEFEDLNDYQVKKLADHREVKKQQARETRPALQDLLAHS